MRRVDQVVVWDEPEEGSEVTRGTVVSGWAYSPAGIRDVSVWLDGQKVVGEAELGLERPDVAQDHPEWADAERSGFRYRLEAVPQAAASAEAAELTVVAEDGEGRQGEARRAVQVDESLFDPIVVWDEPEEGSEVTLGTVVSGWAYSPAGIKEISVWLEGQRVGEAEYGLLREDVAQSRPEWPNALRSGFRYRFETLPTSAEAAELTIVAEDGQGRRTEVRRVVRSVDQLLVWDEPEEGSEVTLGTVVDGWAYSPAGIKEVSVWLDGQRVGEAELGLEREDMAEAHPEWPGAERSGFRCQLEAVPATAASAQAAELTVVAEDGEGRRTEVRRVVRPVAVIVVWDEPEEGSEVTLGTVVSGWAYSPAGIKDVSVWLDGRRMGEATYGLLREDVAPAHPEWPGAERSGFRYRFGAAPVPPLPRTAELVVVAEDGEGSRVEERRAVQVVEPSPPPMAGSLDIPKRRDPGDPLKVMGWSSPLVVHGWAVDPEGVDRIDVMLDGRVVAQAEYGLPREDVEALQWEYRRLGLANRSGWLAVIPTEGFAPGQHTVSATLYGRSGTLPLGSTMVTLLADSVRADPKRQRRFEALLRCPTCGHELARGERGLVCGGCGRTIGSNEFGTLLFDETYAGLDWRQAVATSHGYPPGAAEVIAECRDGLVLEIGAGLRENLPNVIQLDAIAYPNTDVSANGEALPFADESFDGVVACALLEHVSQPAAVVREMRRVCKMGGRIYADCTSVHPYHGFPHHYFNATETGLEWLMREAGGSTGIVTVGDARATIALVLEAWLGSLEDPVARDIVENLPVGDLVAILKEPKKHDPIRYATLDDVFANGRRLIPPKVMFSGIRTR